MLYASPESSSFQVHAELSRPEDFMHSKITEQPELYTLLHRVCIRHPRGPMRPDLSTRDTVLLTRRLDSLIRRLLYFPVLPEVQMRYRVPQQLECFGVQLDPPARTCAVQHALGLARAA